MCENYTQKTGSKEYQEFDPNYCPLKYTQINVTYFFFHLNTQCNDYRLHQFLQCMQKLSANRNEYCFLSNFQRWSIYAFHTIFQMLIESRKNNGTAYAYKKVQAHCISLHHRVFSQQHSDKFMKTNWKKICNNIKDFLHFALMVKSKAECWIFSFSILHLISVCYSPVVFRCKCNKLTYKCKCSGCILCINHQILLTVHLHNRKLCGSVMELKLRTYTWV